MLHHLGFSDHDCLLVSIATKGFVTPQEVVVPVNKEKTFKYATNDEFLMKINSTLGKKN